MTLSPSPELVKARLDMLRGHRWSSYRTYAGSVKPPSWLTCNVLWERARREGEAAAESYRWIVEAPLRPASRNPPFLGLTLRKLSHLVTT